MVYDQNRISYHGGQESETIPPMCFQICFQRDAWNHNTSIALTTEA